MLSDLFYRLRAILQRGAMERELDDELRFHLERETEKHIRAGMKTEDASRQARIAFGGIERVKDESRDARGVALLDAMSQDLRYAIRGLRAKPGFAAAVVLTLGLGIGANAAMFGVVDRLMFRSPTYLQDPGRVNRVFLFWTTHGKETSDRSFEYTRYADLARWTTSFDRVAAFAQRDRKSTRLNSSHQIISYAVFCLKKIIFAGGGDSYAETPSRDAHRRLDIRSARRCRISRLRLSVDSNSHRSRSKRPGTARFLQNF